MAAHHGLSSHRLTSRLPIPPFHTAALERLPPPLWLKLKIENLAREGFLVSGYCRRPAAGRQRRETLAVEWTRVVKTAKNYQVTNPTIRKFLSSLPDDMWLPQHVLMVQKFLDLHRIETNDVLFTGDRITNLRSDI